jgi:cytochrome b6-f complex iron-sulfur subunit
MITRKTFLKQCSNALGIGVIGSLVWSIQKFLCYRPGQLAHQARYDIGMPSYYKKGQLVPVYDTGFIIGKDDNGPYAISGKCSHAGCTLSVRENRLVCPCHGSVFDSYGRPVSGPAGKPLERYPVIPGSDGRLYIENSRNGRG